MHEYLPGPSQEAGHVMRAGRSEIAIRFSLRRFGRREKRPALLRAPMAGLPMSARFRGNSRARRPRRKSVESCVPQLRVSLKKLPMSCAPPFEVVP